MAIRISGLSSGLDTEAIVQQLVSAYSTKKDNYVKAQTKLSWKQDAWKDLNKKIYSLYSSVGNLRYSASYNTKKATISDSTKATVTASGSAVNGTQTLQINKLAKAGYLTGAKLDDETTASTTLGAMGYAGTGTITVNSGGKTTDITVDENTTVSDFVSKLNDAGVKASYDSTNQRIFVSAQDSGVKNDFTLTGADGNGTAALSALGLNVASDANTATYQEWGAYALNTQGQAYYNADGTTNGTFDAAKTKENTARILSEIEAANTAISGAKTSSTLRQAEITTNKSLISYADSYQTVQDVKKQAAANGMSEDNIKAMGDLAQMSDADLSKKYLIDKDGNLQYDDERKPIVVTEGMEYDVNKYDAVKGADLLTGYETTAGLITESPELDEEGNQVLDENGQPKMKTDKSLAEDYAKSLKAVTAYEGNDTVDQDFVNKVHAMYEGADLDYTGIGDYINTLTEANEASQAVIDANNQTIKENNAILDQYALLNNGQDADTLTQRISYAVDSLAGGQTYSIGATRVNAQDAQIILNGAEFTSASNTFSINGLTIEATAETAGEITITTQNDVDGVYNKIKDFIKQYNELINEMTKLYNASSSKGYEPLTSDEKDAMTDTEIEEWEKKIKDSLLRRDDTLGGVMDIMENAMAKSYEINGKKYSLSSFGIKTLGVLNASENEENAYHIDGDPDDSSSSSNQDKLRRMIQSDPDAVAEFMQQLANGLYDALDAKMKSTSLSSAYTVYNDKQMEKEYKEYTTTISKWEDKVSDMEDRYYKQFSAMETALAKLQSSTSSISGLLGS